MSIDFSALAKGDEVVRDTFTLTRDHLVRYAGASGDFNPIHYRDDVAKQVGLEGVLAHGMLTMGVAVSPVLSWLGDSGTVLSYQVRFTKPVYVPADHGAGLTSVVTVFKPMDAESEEVTLTLSVTTEGGDSVLGKAQVVVAAR